MKLKAVLVSGDAVPTIDTVTMPDYDKKGREIHGTDHVAFSRVREVSIRITFLANMSAEDADDLISAIGHGERKVFTIEEVP